MWQVWGALAIGASIIALGDARWRILEVIGLSGILVYACILLIATILLGQGLLTAARLAISAGLMAIGPIGVGVLPQALAFFVLTSVLGAVTAIPVLAPVFGRGMLALPVAQIALVIWISLQEWAIPTAMGLLNSAGVLVISSIMLSMIWMQHRYKQHQIAQIERRYHALQQSHDELMRQDELAAFQRSRERFEIWQLSQAMLEPTTIDAVFQQAEYALRSLVPVDAFGLYWLNSEAGMLEPYAMAGQDLPHPATNTWNIPLGKGIIGHAVASGHSQLVNHAQHDPRSLYAPGERPAIEHMIACPVRARDLTLGVFFVTRLNTRVFTEIEFELVQLLLSCASLGIANARLIEETTRSEARFRSLVANVPSAIYRARASNWSEMFISAAVEGITGYSAQEFVQEGRELFDLIHPEDRAFVSAALSAQRSGALPLSLEYRIFHADGSIRWICDQNRPAFDASGQICWYDGVITDVTHQKHIEQALYTANAKLARSVRDLEQRTGELTTLSQMSEMLQSSKNVVESCHVAARFAEQLFPGSSGALYLCHGQSSSFGLMMLWGGSTPAQRQPCSGCKAIERKRPQVYTADLACASCASHTPNSTICVPLLNQGHVIGLLELSAPGARGGGQATLSDTQQQLAITVGEHLALAIANQMLNEELRADAVRDSLTGLFNRRHMTESLERELRRAERTHGLLGLMMVDIDYFKRVNDTFGHAAGDTLLREVGDYILHSIRAEDIACRYGGEEFLLIMPNASADDLRRRAEDIRRGMHDLHVSHGGYSLGKVTVSIGIAAYPEHAIAVEQLLQATDDALYTAKSQGRDCVVVAEAIARIA